MIPLQQKTKDVSNDSGNNDSGNNNSGNNAKNGDSSNINKGKLLLLNLDSQILSKDAYYNVPASEMRIYSEKQEKFILQTLWSHICGPDGPNIQYIIAQGHHGIHSWAAHGPTPYY